MKIRIGLIALFALAITYAGCKKSNDSPAQTAPTDAVTSQVVQNLMKVLNGDFGVDPSSGDVTVPNAVKQRRLSINSTTGSGCSVAFDTTINVIEREDTISYNVNGEIKLSAICSAGSASGINFFGNYTLTETSPSLSSVNKINENLQLLFGNSNSELSIVFGGTFGLNSTITSLKGSKGTTKQNVSFTFHSLTPHNDGTLGGSADFSVSGSDASSSWNYSGNISFPDKVEAKITISNKVYYVNLTTYVVTSKPQA